MITRNNNVKNNAVRSPNVVLLLLEQLQPHLNSPIDDVFLVENMLRAEFQKLTKLNLLYWVKVLPPIYYHAILNAVTVNAFQEWYKQVFSYKAEYKTLTEEQQNEWELALFYFRDKFLIAFDKHSFKAVLEKKEKDLDVLAWRLQRQPPLPLEVLAKVACLNYSAVQAYADNCIPSLADRVTLAKQAEPGIAKKLVGNVLLGGLLHQHHRWLEYLGVDTKAMKKQSSLQGLGGFLSLFSQGIQPSNHPLVKQPSGDVNEHCYHPMLMGPL